MLKEPPFDVQAAHARKSVVLVRLPGRRLERWRKWLARCLDLAFVEGNIRRVAARRAHLARLQLTRSSAEMAALGWPPRQLHTKTTHRRLHREGAVRAPWLAHEHFARR